MGEWKNAEGYTDTTYGKALELLLPHVRDVWRNNKDKLCIIIKRNGNFYNILQVSDHPLCEVEVHGYKTNPAMLCYAFDKDLCEKVDELTEEEYAVLIAAINDRLPICISEKEYTNEVDLQELENLRRQNEHLQTEMKRITKERYEMEMEREQLRRDADTYKRQYDSIIDKLIGRLVG